MTKTYTIATTHDMMIAIVLDGADIAAAVAHEAEEARVVFEEYDIITGLTLTDDATEDDDIVFRGDHMGNITDENGIGYLYAVRR
jgi:hypothetical protein